MVKGGQHNDIGGFELFDWLKFYTAKYNALYNIKV